MEVSRYTSGDVDAARTPQFICERTPVRTLACFRGRVDANGETHTARMNAQIDSATGRAQYGRRFATVEPLCANLRHDTRLDRCTLRGRAKVDGPWTL